MIFLFVRNTSSQAEGGKVYEALHRAAHQIAELRAEHRSVHSPLKRNVKELSLIAARSKEFN